MACYRNFWANIAAGWAVFAAAAAGCKKGPPGTARRFDDAAAPAVDGAKGLRPGTPPSDREPSLAERARTAIRQGLAALCRFQDKDLRHDTAVGLSFVRRYGFAAGFEDCYTRVKTRALGDHDHPLNHLIDPAAAVQVKPDSIRRLPIPKPGQKRANVNHIVFRASHCRKVPFPAAAFAYLTGPMRDQGGFHSTHALWALIMLRDGRCYDPEKLGRALASLSRELVSALSSTAALSTTEQIDLHAERILFLLMAGSRPAGLNANVAKLLSAQRSDGEFARPKESRVRWRVHSTTVAVWALATWLRRSKPGGAPKVKQ